MTSAIDPTVPVAGTPTTASVRGNFQIAHDEITALQATTPAPSTTPPLMDGTAAVGTGTTFTRADHVHPTDTSRYAASNPAGYQTAAQMAPAFNGVGRNLLHNPLFNVQQRGAGPWTAGGYTADRWGVINNLDAATYGIVSLTDADRAAIGDEAVFASLQNVFTGSGTAGAFNVLSQKIENARRLAGKTVTVSFWARSSVGTLKLGVGAQQNFGSGGSPSGTVVVPGAATAPMGTAWARYSQQITLPSAAGKIFGTTVGTDYTQFNIWYSCTTNGTLDCPPIGQQSGTIQLWGVQLEIGSVMTPLEKPDPRYDLANCTRFYFPSGFILWGGFCTATAPYYAGTALPTMRAQPTLTVIGDTSTNFGARTLNAASPSAAYVTAVAVATGGGTLNMAFSASADL